MTLDDPCGMVFLSARNGQGFPTMQVRLLLQSGTIVILCSAIFANGVREWWLKWCFFKIKAKSSNDKWRGQKKKILSDSIGFYWILSDSPSYLEVFGWSAAGLESWSRLSPAVALLGRSLHPDLRGQTCGRTPWRCLAPAQKYGLDGTGDGIGYWWNFSASQNGGQWSFAICYSHLPLSASTLSTSLLVLELWASWGLNMGVWIWEAYGIVHFFATRWRPNKL